MLDGKMMLCHPSPRLSFPGPCTVSLSGGVFSCLEGVSAPPPRPRCFHSHPSMLVRGVARRSLLTETGLLCCVAESPCLVRLVLMEPCATTRESAKPGGLPAVGRLHLPPVGASVVCGVFVEPSPPSFPVSDFVSWEGNGPGLDQPWEFFP